MIRNCFYYFVILLIVFTVTHPLPTIALDTTEPFDIGFTDNEMYLSFGGVGLDKGDKTLAWEHVIGAGITDRVATTFSYCMESNEFLADRMSCFGVGMYLSVLDLQTFDLDILASVSSEGSFALATEFNLDFSKVGVQLTIEEGIENGDDTKNRALSLNLKLC